MTTALITPLPNGCGAVLEVDGRVEQFDRLWDALTEARVRGHLVHVERFPVPPAVLAVSPVISP